MKRINDWFHKMFGNKLTVRERLFRIILSMGIAAMTLAILSNLLMKQSIIILIPLLVGMAVLLLSLWINYRYHRMELPALLLALTINCIIFPIIFFTSGGIESGATIWFVLGVIFVFLLFTGKTMIVMLFLTIGTFLGTYVYAYFHPEKVIPMASARDVSVDSALALCLVSLTIGVLIKFQNIMYEQERRLSETQKKELEKVSLSKSTFLANMSHEIRTPINTIIGLNEMTLREEVSDEVIENSINIQNASKMLLALINDILDLSKIESGRMELVESQYETGALFSELVNIIWIRAHEKQLEFRIDIDKNIPSMLYGDEVRIRQVLLNILTNAVKYTKEGSITLSANCTKKAANQVELKISVEDTGIGIRKESMGELFSSFRRIDEKKNKNIEGTGLGLSISKRIVDMMGGKIEVDSIYTKGSTFTVTLEQKIVNQDPIGAVDFLIKKNIHQYQQHQQIFEAPKGVVLVVDDNEMNLMVARKLLRDTKVEIDTASSGAECLKKTKNKFYHVIFMDHRMSDMDGVDTLWRLRAQEDGFCKETPVIALTANVMENAQQIYKDYGFDGYLPKPINGALFEATLLKFLPEKLIQYKIENRGNDSDETVKMIRNKKKKSIRILADGACDIPQRYIEQYDIGILYFYVDTELGRFQDVREISSENILTYMESDEHRVASHCPSEEEYESFYANALESAQQVIHITVAKNVHSESFQLAQSVVLGFNHVTIYDSGHLSGGMGILVLTAAKLAQEHKSMEEIVNVLDLLKKKISTSFICPSLKVLRKGGLAGKGMEKFCDMFELHPILCLSQSRIKFQRFQMGEMEECYIKYIKHQLQNPKSIDTRVVFITYSGCTTKQIHLFAEQVLKQVKFEKVIYQQTSAIISCNCGTGTMGVLFLRK